MDTYAANLREINALNQRGGRMLSVVDLIADGTLDVTVAGYLLASVAAGGSFLTAAGPGGVGKTTLLATLLSFLPPNERIVTVTDPWRLDETPAERVCYLCHEIGAGHHCGYLWGDAAARFLSLGRGARVAATLHADSPDEVIAQLLGPSVGAAAADLAGVDLLAFIARIGGMRRVSGIYERTSGGRSQCTASWRPEADSFSVRTSPRLRGMTGRDSRRVLGAAKDCIRRIVDADARMIGDVMTRVADFYHDMDGG